MLVEALDMFLLYGEKKSLPLVGVLLRDCGLEYILAHENFHITLQLYGIIFERGGMV